MSIDAYRKTGQMFINLYKRNRLSYDIICNIL